ACQKFGDAVDMTGHEVPAEFVAEPQRALEIELRAAPPGVGRRDLQRFRSRVDREGGPARLAPTGDDREANPGARNRGANVDCLGVIAAADGQAAQAFGLLADIKNFSYVADNAREHGCHLRSMTMRVSAPDSLATHLSRGDAVNAASAVPSRASTPLAPTTVGEWKRTASSMRSA